MAQKQNKTYFTVNGQMSFRVENGIIIFGLMVGREGWFISRRYSEVIPYVTPHGS